jgi:hypothetical protein
MKYLRKKCQKLVSYVYIMMQFYKKIIIILANNAVSKDKMVDVN